MNDTVIILAGVACVAALGISVFFWWRARYGVWARTKRANPQASARNAVVIKSAFDPRGEAKP